jgi:hypothetical protein
MNEMKHLTETDLNEYLDGLLEPAAQVHMQGHLSDCADCRTRLAALQTVFQALAAIPELAPGRDLTKAVLKSLPRDHIGLGWRLAFAIQAGLSLAVLLRVSPLITNRINGIFPKWTGRLGLPEMRFPDPANLHFSLPVLSLPHLPSLLLPITITHTNFSIWLVLGVAAVLLFIVGNFSLIFYNSTKGLK